MKKITLSEVFKKDLKLIVFLLINGGVALLILYLQDKPQLAILLGGVTNYIAFRIKEELDKEGYIRALK